MVWPVDWPMTIIESLPCRFLTAAVLQTLAATAELFAHTTIHLGPTSLPAIAPPQPSAPMRALNRAAALAALAALTVLAAASCCGMTRKELETLRGRSDKCPRVPPSRWSPVGKVRKCSACAEGTCRVGLACYCPRNFVDSYDEREDILNQELLPYKLCESGFGEAWPASIDSEDKDWRSCQGGRGNGGDATRGQTTEPPQVSPKPVRKSPGRDDEKKSSKGLGVGPIAGIVSASAGVIGVLIAAAAFYYQRNRNGSSSEGLPEVLPVPPAQLAGPIVTVHNNNVAGDQFPPVATPSTTA